MKKRVIIVTDGDHAAKEAVTTACANVGAYPLTITAGNPSRLTGEEVLFQIKSYPGEPVVVMADDGGWVGEGRGESIISYLLKSRDEIELLGVVAVASGTRHARGVVPDCSWTRQLKKSYLPVNKLGFEEQSGHEYLEGDTTELLLLQNNIRIIGCGDPGKMDWRDDPAQGAPVTTACLRALINQPEREGIEPA
ncbi:MAG: stage V sporulation protein AE [Methylocystaceae bacterium]